MAACPCSSEDRAPPCMPYGVAAALARGGWLDLPTLRNLAVCSRGTLAEVAGELQRHAPQDAASTAPAGLREWARILSSFISTRAFSLADAVSWNCDGLCQPGRDGDGLSFSAAPDATDGRLTVARLGNDPFQVMLGVPIFHGVVRWEVLLHRGNGLAIGCTAWPVIGSGASFFSARALRNSWMWHAHDVLFRGTPGPDGPRWPAVFADGDMMGSLVAYACVRWLKDVGVPPAVRTGSVQEVHPELKSPVRVELEVHRQPRCGATTSPLDTAGAATAPSAPLVMGIAGRTCEYCRQWLQDRAAGASAAANEAGGAAAAAVPPFVTHMYFSADGVPPLHAVMTDSYGEWSSVPPDEALYLLLTMHSCPRAFRGPDGRIAWEPPYEAVLGLGKVWVNGRLVVDPPPAAYATREGDAHPSGIDPASVRLAELRVAAMAAAIARGARKAEAEASGHAAVAAAVADGREAGPEAPEGFGAGTAVTGDVGSAGADGAGAGSGSAR